MTAKQKRLLQGVEEIVGAMVAELNPRVIVASEEKQAELGIAEETMLIPVGPRRVITLCATEAGDWSLKEFDTNTGSLVQVREEVGDLGNNLVGAVLGAVVTSLQWQLALRGADSVTTEARIEIKRNLAELEPRQARLAKEGIGSFEFEPVFEPSAVAATPAPTAPATPVASTEPTELVTN